MSTTDVTFYNHEQKERYISEREISYRKIRLITRTFFNITKEFEEELGKDCSNFTTKEILNMYNFCATRSWEFLLNFNSQLRIYTAWCLRESLVKDNQNHYDELDKHDMYNCLNLGLKKKMVLTRKEVEKELAQIPNVSDQFLVLAFFEGVGGPSYSDFYELGMSQFEGNKLILNGRELEVSNLLIERARESSEEYQKYNLDGQLRTGYRKDDPYIVKDSTNASTDSLVRNMRKIQRRIASLEHNYGKEFGAVGLRNSGRIDMLKHLMAKDGSNDVRATYEKHKDEIEIRYGKLQRIYRWVDEYKIFFDNSL